MRSVKNTLVLMLVISGITFGRILSVPKDYQMIQAAINSAQNTDTVLVAEGTYYENINFCGKGILITSNFIYTKNSETIINTIINGSRATDPASGSVVSFLAKEDSSSILQGFTITGGSGTKYAVGSNAYQEGGGIILSYSSATIRYNIIRNNITVPVGGAAGGGGGGISSMYGNPNIYNNVIMENKADYASGIVLNWSGGKVRNNLVYHNKGVKNYGAGGVMVWASPANSAFVENNTIIGNYSEKNAGAMVIYNTVNPVIKNNIIWGNRQVTGGQVDNPQFLNNNDVEDVANVQNINQYPRFSGSDFILSDNSPCVDAGDTSLAYFDAEDILNPGRAKFPSRGSVKNDIGAFGGKYANAFIPLLDVSDVFYTKNSISVQADVNKTSTARFEVLNVSSKALIIDSIRQTNNQQFKLTFKNMSLNILQKDTLYVDFNSPIAGSYTDTIKLYHNAKGVQSPLLFIASGKSVPAAGVKTNENADMGYQLYPNYPNPFNPVTKIGFSLPTRSYVSLKIYDILGRELKNLLSDELSAGKYSVDWEPARELGSGVYFVNINAGDFSASRKVIFQK